MRLLVCLVVCAIAAAAPAVVNAQTPAGQSDRRVEVGAKVGVTSSTIAVTGVPGFEPEAGAGAMGGAWISLGRRHVRFQTEVTYGARHFSSASPIGEIKVSANLVEIPALVVGRWRLDARTKPFLFGGVSLGFLSRVRQTVGPTETDIDDQIKNTDVGAAFGGGLDVSAGRGAVVFDVRYTVGLRDVSESDVTSFKQRAFAFSIGYRF